MIIIQVMGLSVYSPLSSFQSQTVHQFFNSDFEQNLKNTVNLTTLISSDKMDSREGKRRKDR